MRALRIRNNKDAEPVGGQNDWERVARERVEDGRLKIRGGAALGISMFGSAD